MRFLRPFIFFVGCLVATIGQAAPSIRVQPGDWGSARVDDIGIVLISVAEVLLADFPRHAAVRIEVRPTRAGPRVLEEKTGDGAYQVLLDVRDARWDQFAYQFSHELCHIFSNYEQRALAPARQHQWFEEAVCEAVSIVALHRTASLWERTPPRQGWQTYAPAFRQYAQLLAAQAHRHLPAGTTLAAWYGEQAAAMASEPYLREKNELVAGALVELFERAGLQAIGYLNLDTAPAPSFAAYLAAWQECCPQAHRPLVERLIQLFAA